MGQMVQTKKHNLNSQINVAIGNNADCCRPGKQIDRDGVIRTGAINEETDCLTTGSSFEQEDLISFEDCQGEFNNICPGSGSQKVNVFDTFTTGAGTDENRFVEGETSNDDGLLNTI